MKKYPTGFQPIDYKNGSIVFLIIGILSLIASLLTNIIYLFYFGFIALSLSAYFFYIFKSGKA